MNKIICIVGIAFLITFNNVNIAIGNEINENYFYDFEYFNESKEIIEKKYKKFLSKNDVLKISMLEGEVSNISDIKALIMDHENQTAFLVTGFGDTEFKGLKLNKKFYPLLVSKIDNYMNDVEPSSVQIGIGGPYYFSIEDSPIIFQFKNGVTNPLSITIIPAKEK